MIACLTPATQFHRTLHGVNAARFMMADDISGAVSAVPAPDSASLA